MAGKPDSFEEYERLLVGRPLSSPWNADGEYEPDFDLLTQLLAIPLRDGASQASGRIAKAVDAWTAQELRRAGFDRDEVWPRITRPRVLARELKLLLDNGPKKLQPDVLQAILNRPSLGPAEANVLGRVFSKQADVLIAHWARGPELLVSTKTMLSSYGKNLRNRFEEAYGDAKNLRGRFPLLALGFLFLVRSDIPEADFLFAQDMLVKLTDEKDGYDRAALIVLDFDDKPPSIPPGEHEPNANLVLEAMPDNLSVAGFLGGLVDDVLDRTPVDHHTTVRSRREREELPVVEGEYDEEPEPT